MPFHTVARILRCGSAFFALALAVQGFAQTKSVAFSGGGATAYDGWSNLTYYRLSSAVYGGWPGSQDWTQAVVANAPGSGGGSINRLAKSPNGGGPYPGEFSLYFGSSKVPIVPNTLGGTLGVSRSPVSGVKTVVFQIELGEGEPHGQTRFFFHEPADNPTGGRPTLYVNGVAIAAPNFTTLVNQRITGGGGESGDDEVYVNTYGYQWNIATTNVTSLQIRFSCVEHASIYEMRLDQTSVLQSNNVFETNSTAPVINLSGTGLSFGNVVVGSTKTGTLTIQNTGTAALTVTNITYPNPAFTGVWSGTIAQGASTNVTVTFNPAAVTNYSGNITVNSSATNGANTIAVSGNGTAATRIIGLSGDMVFGNVTVNSTTTRTLTISNTGNSALNVSSIAYPSGFTGNWSSGSIAAGASRNVTVTFSPVVAQSYSGTITVLSDRTSGTNTISTSGTGTALPTRVIGLPASLDFGPCPVGGAHTLSLIISNSGNASLNVSDVSYPPGFSGETSGSSIPSGGSRNVTVTFTPDAAGSFSGTISVVSDATAGGGFVPVSAEGVAPMIAPVLLRAPVLVGTNTIVTNTFRSTPATWLDIAFTDNVAATNSWMRHPSRVYSGGGEFDVVFTHPGDQRTNWQRGMFFRLLYPTKQ